MTLLVRLQCLKDYYRATKSRQTQPDTALRYFSITALVVQINTPTTYSTRNRKKWFSRWRKLWSTKKCIQKNYSAFQCAQRLGTHFTRVGSISHTEMASSWIDPGIDRQHFLKESAGELNWNVDKLSKEGFKLLHLLRAADVERHSLMDLHNQPKIRRQAQSATQPCHRKTE